MKVIVDYSNIDPTLKENIESHIHAHWRESLISPETKDLPIRKNPSPPALLSIKAEANSAAEESGPLKETIVVGNTSSVDEVLYLVDAKLGRLTKSDLANTKQPASPKLPVTRREFLLGFARGLPRDSDLPVVSADSCEARFGCSKCVDACPAPGALKIENGPVTVSGEYCIRCGLCAGVCPVAAIQIPKFSEDAFRGLLTAIDSSSAPRKTLVLTCDERGVAPEPWMVVEEVPQVGVVGLRHLALAANTSIGAVIVYCHDGLCAGKDNAKQAISLISSITGESGPVLCYFEGETGSTKIGEVHRSAKKRETSGSSTFGPWKDYAHSLKSIAKDDVQAAGFGLTDMKVDNSCTLCNACVEGCPHGALAIQEGELAFQPEECTGCGFCEKICPEHSITLPEMTGIMTLSTRMVYKDEMVRCAKCNAPFASTKMLKKISDTLKINQTTTALCPSCRQKEIHDLLLNKTRNVPSNSAWPA